MTFMKTAGTYPKTIFFVSAAAITIAFTFISLVKLPDSRPSDDVEGAVSHGVEREDTLVGVPEPLIVVEDVDENGPKVVKP